MYIVFSSENDGRSLGEFESLGLAETFIDGLNSPQQCWVRFWGVSY